MTPSLCRVREEKVNELKVVVLSIVNIVAWSQLLHRVPVVSGHCCEGIRPVHSLNHSDFRSKGLKQD